jgi:lysophospholipase L1-like esterase
MRAISIRRIAVGLYTLGWGVFYAGFLWRASWAAARVDLHSRKYIVILFLGLVPFAFPGILRRMREGLGSWRQVILALVPTFVLLLLGYIVALKMYNATRIYPFHPFLQVSVESFNSIPKSKQPNTFRILTLGGSTTRDWRLQERDRYPAVLERILQERYPKTRIEVLNGGMDWYTTEHVVIFYAFGARDWSPDMVVFFEAINDIYRSCTSPRWAVGEYKSDYSHYYGPEIRAYHTPSFESWLLDLIAPYWFPNLRRQPEPADVPLEFFQSIAAHDRNTRTLIRLVRADGKRLVIGTQASLFRSDLTPEEIKVLLFGKEFCLQDNKYPDHTSFMRAMKKANDGTKRIAKEEDVPLAEIDAAVPKTLEFFSDDVHSTPRAARIVAETVAQTIIRAGYLQ